MIPQRRRGKTRYVALAMLACGSVALASCASSAGPGTSSTGTRDGLRPHLASSCTIATRSQFPKDSRLDGVVVTAPCSAWAVGSYRSGFSALIERWNGSSWSQVRAPAPNSNSALVGVASDSPADVWAVGIRGDVTQRHARTLIEHWSGRTWSVVPSPNPARSFSSAILTSVSARSSKDAWAAGYYVDGAEIDRTLIEHWNGSYWRIVPSPNAAGSQTGSVLTGISATPDAGAWAVGFFTKSPATWSLIERWDGQRWRIVPSPDAGQSGLEAVTASSPTGTWAVGWSHHGTSNRPEIARWTGRSWHLVQCPDPGSHRFAELVGVTSTATRALAVGFYQGRTTLQAMALAWNGIDWSVVPIRGLAGPRGAVFNLASASGLAFGRPWIVGFWYTGLAQQAIAVRG